MGIEAFRFDNKRVLVVGGATGMGAAAAETAQILGADVFVMDYAKTERQRKILSIIYGEELEELGA